MAAGTSRLAATRESDFPKWYLEVIKHADLAENSVVRGCMVIKPWGYAIWEQMQADLDRRFKETGHVNAYFPLFIPKSLIEKEADHVEGFAKEMAVVTHHRLKAADDGSGLVPDGELAEPLVVRPTSETIIGESFSRWIQSYRDLPLLINQWANVVRWELRTRMFLRTTEFLWQEGHTVHATAEEAAEETARMLEVYRAFSEDVLAMPVITGEKTPEERFPGAVRTFCIEAIMQDGKALQAGTSHDLGQNFAKGSGITFSDKEGEVQHAWTTSWGASTRLIGGVIMTHSDDNGLRLPPSLSPHQIVVIPMDLDDEVVAAAQELATKLRGLAWRRAPVRVHVDGRDFDAPTRRWEWVRRGVPLIVQLGKRDLGSGKAMLSRRWREQPDRELLLQDEIVAQAVEILEDAQTTMWSEAAGYRDAFLRSDFTSVEEIAAAYESGFDGVVIAPWDGEADMPERLAKLALSRRCATLTRRTTAETCLFSGNPATQDLVLAKSY
ncbi:proline--tRNA ligase [Patulibacter sp.]|uniref:proline--tRNA ligase n=1 Tax=Patulibacter sp. TaxID=1912859 RepID=UPI002718DE8A|nr:proline--tRNA ligase [Patulibacter sp.]MDO9409291.1 proline--tRNA ligase [Patulibacter sp.]